MNKQYIITLTLRKDVVVHANNEEDAKEKALAGEITAHIMEYDEEVEEVTFDE